MTKCRPGVKSSRNRGVGPHLKRGGVINRFEMDQPDELIIVLGVLKLL